MVYNKFKFNAPTHTQGRFGFKMTAEGTRERGKRSSVRSACCSTVEEGSVSHPLFLWAETTSVI